ncbi:Glycosyltransferase (fragment) [Xenorhabdus cabanillasii JM26]|uniref:Glycosyltransferase n=2 Tax=Xenorhabdus cabanillasii TaxID=351673 RepID=W1J182_9GAMM
MILNYEQKYQITIDNNFHITNSGIFIRKYKLDELAQRIDIIRGMYSIR